MPKSRRARSITRSILSSVSRLRPYPLLHSTSVVPARIMHPSRCWKELYSSSSEAWRVRSTVKLIPPPAWWMSMYVAPANWTHRVTLRSGKWREAAGRSAEPLSRDDIQHDWQLIWRRHHSRSEGMPGYTILEVPTLPGWWGVVGVRGMPGKDQGGRDGRRGRDPGSQGSDNLPTGTKVF